MEVWSNITRKLALAGMVPRTRMAFAIIYLAAIEAAVILLQWLLKAANAHRAARALSGWTVFLGWAISILLIILALRWLRDNVMWSVRNRLIVTYLFIGGVPVTLAVAIALLSGYLLVGDLAVFSAVSEIKTEANRLGASNAAAEEEITRHSSTPQKIAAADASFPGRSISILPKSALPGWVRDGFAGVVSENGHIYLRAANRHQDSHGPSMVVSTVLFDQKFLGRIASKVGSLTLYSLDPQLNGDEKSVENALSSAQSGAGLSGRISAGSVSDPVMALDREFDFGGPIQVTDWANGSARTRILGGTTRLSTVYSYLTASMGIGSTSILIVLIVLAIAFAIVVLIALLIGVGLTRKITYSVANLYRATQFINRGDFSHRIDVRAKDQLAALQVSFNSMTDNLEKLIAEQKEKERLQSELEIAHEVQAQLFPRSNVGTSTLELHGICRPARIVSGDYYDFLSYGPEQVMVAVGDVSGKGISAALLMATIHSAVRAYEQEQLASVGVAAAYGTTSRVAALEARVAPPSPAQMLWLLNRHLFQSTQPEKYATLFLGFYDDHKHRLTYSNAGHLPPIVVATDGTVRRLGTGGTVVGLFPDCDYEEETVELYPGDIFIAFSDGITEPENEFGEFGEDRLVETVGAHRQQPLERITEHVISAVQDWIGSTEQPDDITLVLARRI
ncbi:MAG TPA: PP2C family protein-serine/threonine phosphatase [Candidatus Angelobacter sp.]|nr:PP2C family protein-serine/threonine phosphatase [Candidatus Angelobacter sp.]